MHHTPIHRMNRLARPALMFIMVSGRAPKNLLGMSRISAA
jgi:hypothetical protein